jgi:hypothetical protein
VQRHRQQRQQQQQQEARGSKHLHSQQLQRALLCLAKPAVQVTVQGAALQQGQQAQLQQLQHSNRRAGKPVQNHARRVRKPAQLLVHKGQQH